ncbi:RWD domain-containing protein, partial [Cynara cardunculus var. scolymus]
MTDHAQEQEMEIEALKAILMDEFEEIHPSESGLNTSNRCFQIKLSLQTSSYEHHAQADPLTKQAQQSSHKRFFLDDETDESSSPVQLGLIFSHTEKYPDEIPLLNLKSIKGIQASDLAITVPHGEPVTVETFLAWRERFEAELALERAKLLPESALIAPKEKKLTGRQWFQSGRASA